MPHAHIVFAHPEPTSLTARLAQAGRDQLLGEGWDISLSDLYSLGFDPAERPSHYEASDAAAPFHVQTAQRAAAGAIPPLIASEIAHLDRADLLIVHFPMWWFGPPAMMKGWMDRVFVYGEMYRSTMRYGTGRFRGRRMLACVTFGAPETFCGPDGREGNARMHLFPVLYPFHYLGYEVLEPELMFGIGSTVRLETGDSDAAAQSELDTRIGVWKDALAQRHSREAVRYNADEDFGADGRLKAGAETFSPFIRRAD
ncbi:MAG: NAD(P)H-dependent oxidoreductase [Pseudomonadota bacterium]